MLAILLVVCFITICTTKWIQPSNPLLFTSDDCLSVGFYKGSIYLLGGYNEPYQLTEYVIERNLFIDHGREALDALSYIYGYSQYWTQIHNLLYVKDADAKIGVFNMQTKIFTSSVIVDIPNDDIDSCMTSNSTHIFLIGGRSGSSLVRIYDLYTSTNQWITSAPSMNSARCGLSCIIHPINGNLYAIGGQTSSIEIIQSSDILHQTWRYIDGTLSQSLDYSLSVIYKHRIYVIGGAGFDGVTTKTVHIINVLTDEVSVLSDPLPIGLCHVAPIVVDQRLYVFGGWIDDNSYNYSIREAVDSWMMYDLYIPTASPTEEPTEEPTVEPTVEHTLEPTLEPTVEPTSSLPTLNMMTSTTATEIVTSMPTNMDFTTDSITYRPTTKGIVAFPPTIKDRTVFDSTKQMTSDTSHVMTDLLSTHQDEDMHAAERISTLHLVIIVMITLVVIILVLVLIILSCVCVQKLIIELKKKSDDVKNIEIIELMESAQKFGSVNFGSVELIEKADDVENIETIELMKSAQTFGSANFGTSELNQLIENADNNEQAQFIEKEDSDESEHDSMYEDQNNIDYKTTTDHDDTREVVNNNDEGEIKADHAFQAATKTRQGVQDGNTNMEQIPLTVEGLETHAV